MSEPEEPQDNENEPRPDGEEPNAPEVDSPGEERDGFAAGDEEPDSDIRDMLRGAMRHREEEEAPPPDVLRGVQRRLRERSGGKFYADGWSTTRHQPISMFLLTSLLMLAIVFVVYAVLSPTAGKPVHVNNAPAPVHVIPPRHH